MTNKSLINELNSLKNIKPEDSWKKSNREILFSQISSSSSYKTNVFSEFIIVTRNALKVFAQPAMGVLTLILVLVTGVVASKGLLNNTTPNESLYIAKTISDKAQMNMIFNEEKKSKFTMQVATDRAKDITMALLDPEFNVDDNKEEIEKLNTNFRSEIQTLKVAMAETEAPVEEVENDIFVANSEKDDNGVVTLKKYIQEESLITPILEEELVEEEIDIEEEPVEEEKDLLDQIQESFDNGDMKDAGEKLDELKVIIDNK